MRRLDDRLAEAGVVFAYIQKLPAEGSLTVFLRRRGPLEDAPAPPHV